MGCWTPVTNLLIQFVDHHLTAQIPETVSFQIGRVKVTAFICSRILGEIEEMWRGRVIISHPFVEMIRNVICGRIGTSIFEVYDNDLLGKIKLNFHTDERTMILTSTDLTVLFEALFHSLQP